MTSTTDHDRPGSGSPTAGADEPRRPAARDRTVLLDRPAVAPAAPVLLGCLLAAASLAVLCVLAVLVPAPRLAVGPVVVAGGAHDPRVLAFLVLVTLAGSALGIGLLRSALPRAEAAAASPAVDRSALVLRPAGPVLAAVARRWAALVLLVVAPAWLGLLPLPVVGLVLPFAVAACAPALLVRRVAVGAATRRGLPVLARGAGAALAGDLTLAGPVREAPPRVVLTGELLAPASRRSTRSGPGTTAGASAADPPAAGQWGFQAGPTG